MTRKTKLLKQVSVGCLTLLLSGAPNAFAVVTATAQADDIPGQSVIEPERDIPELTASPDSATSDPVPIPESDTSDQPLAPDSDTHEQPASSQAPLSSNAKLPKPQMPQPVKSEVKATTTSQKKVNPDTPTVSAEKEKSMSSPTGTLRGANPKDGTPGLVYNKDYTEVIEYTGKETDIVIPEGVISIGKSAFSNKHLSSVTLPSSLTSIKEAAFHSNQLSGVMLPSSLTNIGPYAFYSNQLSGVTLSASLTSIGKYAFYDNELSSVTLPASLTSIEFYAFARNKLSSVTFSDSVTSIGDGAFRDNQLTSVTLPSSLTSIGSYVFLDNQLTSVTLPASLTSIGDGTFWKNQLTSVTLPASLTSIGYAAFYGNKLTSIKFSSSLISIGVEAFRGNQLTSVTLPDSLKRIDNSAFYQNKLTSITVPDSVPNIGATVAAWQSAIISRVRRASYTASELGISTHYKTDKPAKLTSQTKGVTVDGDSVKLDPNFTDDEFIVLWSAWDKKHTGTLTVKLVDAVEGKITYLDDAGKPLLADRDVSSMVTGTFDWMAPESISDYTVDLDRSQILTLSDTGLQTTSLKDKLLLTQTTTLAELIDYLKQQPIAPRTQSVELRYVYTKNPAKKGQVTVKYMDTEGRAVAEDKVLSDIVGTSYITERIEIDGYTLKTINGKSTGEYTLDPQVVTYVYTKVDKQPVIPTPDSKQPDEKTPDSKQPDDKVPDNKIPDNKVPDNKTPDNADAANKTPNKQKPENTQVGDQSSQNNSQANQQLDKQTSRDQKLLAKQNRHTTKEATANQLPKTGESQKSTLVQVLVGAVIVLLSMSLIGLDRKRKHSGNR